MISSKNVAIGINYPTSNHKINLAKAVVKTFPILKASRDNVEGYISLNNNMITWLQYQVPSDPHKTEILEAMMDTFEIRRNFIKNENPSVSAILKKYPKFKDFGGILVDAEFKKLYPAAGDFLAIFPTNYTQRIIKYTRQNRLDIYERLSLNADENFRALLMLADLLPIAGFRKKRKVSGNQSLDALFPSDALVRFIGTNGSLEECIKVIEEKQPYLLCTGEKCSPGTFFLILDEQVVDVGKCGFKAFDFLYKSHYIFNVKFTEQLSRFYNFMDTMIYNVINGPARSSVESLNIVLKTINVI